MRSPTVILKSAWNSVRGLRKYLYPNRRLHFTREGWIFSAVTLCMGLIAINTGHNLFYLVFALLLSAVIVSGLLSERVLSGIEVRRRLPPEATARVPFAVIVEVRNPHPSKTSYSLKISDAGDFLPRRALGRLLSLGPGEAKSFPYLAQVGKRGPHRFGQIHVVSRFPFGLFEKVRLIPMEELFVAYPGIKEVPALHALASERERSGSKKWRWGEEIRGLRPAVAEDDHRLIHWGTSARMGQLMVKEFVEEVSHPRAIFFDNRGTEGEEFEAAVEVAATLLRMLASRRAPFCFCTWEEHFQPAASGQETTAALRHLALIAPFRGTAGKGFDHWRHQLALGREGIFLQADVPPPSPLPPCTAVKL